MVCQLNRWWNAHPRHGLTSIAGKPHYWPELILEHLFFITVVDNLRRYPLFVTLGKWILPTFTVSTRNKHTGYARNQVST